MRLSFFEWLGRVVMLVLAGMITLSIIGAIAAIPSGAPLPPITRTLPGLETVEAPSPGAEPARRPEQAGTAGQAPGAPTSVVGGPDASEKDDPARWLESITYALLALVGIAALACVLLWRSLHERRRIADALERISASSTGLRG